MDEKKNNEKKVRRPFKMERGVLYYTKEIERKVFFILTVAMLIAGILVKTGLLQR